MVVESYSGLESWNFTYMMCTYSNAGYIGYYSFDGINFKAAFNDSAYGASITTVTDKIEAEVEVDTIIGIWLDLVGTVNPNEYELIDFLKYTNSVEKYHSDPDYGCE